MNGRGWKRKWLLGTLLLAVLIGQSSCTTTVTPKIVRDSTASFDGNAQNSGFLGYTEDGYGVITEKARKRYNALIKTYGKRYPVTLKPDAGLKAFTNGTWLIDNEHDVKATEMNLWRKSGR